MILNGEKLGEYNCTRMTQFYRILNVFRKNGHTVVGVFTIPDKNGREVSW